MLTISQLAHFQERLEANRVDLLSKIEALDDELARAEYDGVQDISDSAMEIYTEEEKLSQQNHLKKELVLVENALLRIEAGSYGYSDVSGKPIPIERLEVLPWATTLVDESPLR